MGKRPLRDFNQVEFENLCKEQRTVKDICRFFCTTEKTLYRWVERIYKSNFSNVYQQKREEGRTILLNNAIKLAKNNATMSIFLLKNWCGYTDQPKAENSDNVSLMQNLIDIHKQYTENESDDK